MAEQSPLGLTAAQLAERRLHLHAGDAAALMAGDFRKVYRRIKGLDPEEDLSGEFRVQLGSYTEPFGLWWTEKMTGREVEYHSDNPLTRYIWHALTGREANPELVVSADYPFMAVNLDAISTTPQGHRAVLDAKHVARSGDAEILRYTPAGVFQATVCGLDWWGLALIVGNKWEPPIFQEVDPLYQATLIARARECWGYIERSEEPPEAAPVAPPKPQPKLREVIVPPSNPAMLDLLCRQNNWLSAALEEIPKFIGTEAAAKAHAIAREHIKEAIPEDVGLVRYGRFKASRSKVGSITMTVDKLEENGA